MNLFEPKLNKSTIQNIINDLNDYEIKVKERLGINDIEYTKVFDFARSTEGYVEPNTHARAIPDDNFLTVNEIYYSVESIRNYINDNFARVNDLKILAKLTEIYVKYIIAHELIHVKQIIEQSITREIYITCKRTEYCDREYEKDANIRAKNIVESEGDLERLLLPFLLCKKGLDNYKAQEIKDIYNRLTKSN